MQIPYIEDFGGGVGVADNTPAFNAAVLAGVAVKFRDTYPQGQYTFASEPDIIPKTFAIYGALPGVPGHCWVKRNYQPSPDRGLFHFTGGQPYVQDLMILATAGTGGRSIVIQPDADKPTACGTIKHVRITTSGGTWKNTIVVDGSSNTNPGGPGARGLTFDDVMVFGASETACTIKSVVHFNWKGGSVCLAGGTNGGLLLTGTPSSPSSENTLRLDYVTGNVQLSYFRNSIVDVAELGSNVLNDSTVSGIRGRGVVLGGTIQGNWSNSNWT